MFGTGFKFKAKIKVGARIGQDHRFGTWPNAMPPPEDPNMVFTAELFSSYFDLEAPGYGGKPYGNGSIGVWSFSELEVSEDDRERVIEHLRKIAKKKVDDAAATLAKFHNELDAIV